MSSQLSRSLSRGRTMRRRNSRSNSSVEARERASPAYDEYRGGSGLSRRSLTTSSLGSPPARMLSMLPGAHASLFSSMAYVPGLALRTPFSMSERVRTVNWRLLARSVRFRYRARRARSRCGGPAAPRRVRPWMDHDALGAAMSNYHAHLFLLVTQMGGNYFRGTPARSALTWVIVSQNSSSTLSFDRPATSTLGIPASSRRTTFASGRASPVHHSWRISKSSKRSPSRVLRSSPRRLLTGTRAHHCARQYGPSYCPGGGPVSHSSTWKGSLGAIPL